VTIYKDGIVLANFNITYLPPTTHILQPAWIGTQINTKAAKITAYILLIIISIGAGVYWKGTTAGAHTFRIGSLLLTAIMPTFWLLGLISVLHYALKYLHKMVSE
jgi:hypothetical protein